MPANNGFNLDTVNKSNQAISFSNVSDYEKYLRDNDLAIAKGKIAKPVLAPPVKGINDPRNPIDEESFKTENFVKIPTYQDYQMQKYGKYSGVNPALKTIESTPIKSTMSVGSNGDLTTTGTGNGNGSTGGFISDLFSSLGNLLGGSGGTSVNVSTGAQPAVQTAGFQLDNKLLLVIGGIVLFVLFVKGN